MNDTKARGLAWIAERRAAGDEPTNARVRAEFDVSERTARNWLRGNGASPARSAAGSHGAPDRVRYADPAVAADVAKAEPGKPMLGRTATGSAYAGGNGTGKPRSSGKDPAPVPPPGGSDRGGKRRRFRRKHRQASDRQPARQAGSRIAMAATAIGITAVVAAPAAISARSLAGWGRDQLGLTDGWEWLVPVPLDGAALACVGLALHATQRGEAPGFARILVWVLASCSAGANYRHGATVSPDAAIFFAAMPLLAALLLDLALRRVRHTALGGLGALERPLARYRMARWLVAPQETWSAWRTAVCDGITDPDEALARARAARARHSVTESPDEGDAGETPETRHSSEAS